MIRKQVFIKEEQETRLKALAERLGVAEAELIREGIELVLQEKDETDDNWKERFLQAAGIWKDRDDLEQVRREFRESCQPRYIADEQEKTK